MLMQISCDCCLATITPVTLKAFDDNGNFLYEYWMACVYESHAGTLYGLEIREITPAWEAFIDLAPNYGFSSSSISQPVKNGTRPLGVTGSTLLTCRQFALDSVAIDRTTGSKTVLHADVDYVYSEYDPSAFSSFPMVKVGLPSFPTSSAGRSPQRYEVTDDGTCCLRNPLVSTGVLFFDYWKQSTTSRYRICARWHAPNGSPSQWTWTNGASSATFATTASAATIQTALESITGVVSATVTGGPLPLAHVDIEIEWTTNTGRFTNIAVQRVSTTGNPLYNFAAGKIAGRSTYSVPPGSIDIITSDNTGVVMGNARRHLISSDASGALISTSTVWSVTAISSGRTPSCSGMGTTAGVSRAAFGLILVTVNRSTQSGTTLTHVVLNETTGASVGNGDGAMDFPLPLFADSSNVAFWGIDDCGLRMTGGEQFAMMATTGGTASNSFMVQGFLCGTDGATAVLANSTIAGPTAVDEVSYPDFSGLLDAADTTTVTNTTVTGGDAFFPTATYIRKRVFFSSPATLWNDTTEWKIVLYNGTTKIHETAWLSYGDGDAAVEAELDAWYGNNSAGLPAIQLQFASTDNSTTPLMWFQRSGAEILVTASNDSVAIATHNLVPSGYTYRIELRNANVRFQRAICAVDVSDSSVLWQRDIGQLFPGLSDNSSYLPTFDYGVVVAFTTIPRQSGSHPTIGNGPLP